MTADNQKQLLEDAKLRVEEAKTCLHELKKLFSSFSEKSPCKFFEEIDPQTSEILLKVCLIQPLPSKIKIEANNIISHLRSALDYTACALAIINGKQESAVYFPSAKNIEEFESKECQSKIQKLSPEAIAFIKSYEPYKGGKGEIFWMLNQLWNIGKHRKLVAVGSCSISLMMESIHVKQPSVSILCPSWNFEEESMLLLRRSPQSEVEYNIKIPLHLGIRDVEFINNREPIVPVFKEAVNAVEKFINDCERRFFRK